MVTQSSSSSSDLWLDVSVEVLKKATQLANARLTESARRSSPDRPSARNLDSQIRGAVGELIASEWLRANSFKVDDGYMDDHILNSDLVVNGVSIEVMTAKIEDRKKLDSVYPRINCMQHDGVTHGDIYSSAQMEIHHPRRF